MKSLSSQFRDVTRLKSSTNTFWTSFYAYKDGQWEIIKESEFWNAVYSNQFVMDEEASTHNETVYTLKL
jgi:hypothetical protein